MATNANRHTKDKTLAHWKTLKKTDPLPHMEPIKYKARGSRYGACGIRIDGTPEFIDAVLSQLQSLIPGENSVTRLELSRSQVDGATLGKTFENQANAAEVCYIRLHVRGGESQTMLSRYDAGMKAASLQYAEALGVK